MSSNRSTRKSTQIQTAQVKKCNALESKSIDTPDQDEIERRRMVLNGWDFDLIYDYDYGDTKEEVIKNMTSMYAKVKHHFSKSKLKKLKEYEEQSYAMINTKPEIYYIKSLPNELTFNLQVNVDKKGFGVLAGKPIAEGEIIIPYLGEISCLKSEKVDSNYIMHIGEIYEDDDGTKLDEVTFAFSINSLKKGNLSRFINHSCHQGNLNVIEGWFEGKLYKLFIANKAIEKGQELLYNYEMEILNHAPLHNCYCEGDEPEKVHKFGVRPKDKYTCKFWNAPVPCTKRFYTSHQKYEHELFAHGQVSCEECAKKPVFTSLSGLYYHRETKHGLKGLPPSLRKRKIEPGPSTAVDSETDGDEHSDSEIKSKSQEDVEMQSDSD